MVSKSIERQCAIRGSRPTLWGLAGLMVVVLLNGCGGSGDDGTAADKSGDTASDTQGAQRQASTSLGARAGSSDRCPLTADQVSNVLRASVEKDDASCTYAPAGDRDTPNAAFNRQLDFACTGNHPSEVGYTTKLDGLGVDAYVQPDTAIGTMILVCAKSPFEITVNAGSDSAQALAAARELARLALASS